MMIPVLYIVIPCYNEEDVLPITAPMFLGKLEDLISRKKIHNDSRILFVDDGSRDRTWDLVSQLAQSDYHYTGIQQSRNRGHQNAVLAGMMEARSKCHVVITIDCDGQDDINAMDEMVDLYLEGNEIVYGVRNNRDTDTFFKRFTAESFYKLLSVLGVDSVYNHADYRLVSSKVLDAFSDFSEVNLFLRGMFPLVGFQSASVYYSRNIRLAGESHYPFKKMLALAIDGVTSLSIKPLRLITSMGLVVALLSFIGIIWSFITVFRNQAVPGWASMISIICFLSGIQLISVGVIGEYVGKIYMETKRRPRYIISKYTDSFLRSKEKEEQQ